MSWTAPITYTTGMLMTAVIANQQWRDNLLLLATSLDTSTGKLNAVGGVLAKPELTNYVETFTSPTIAGGTLALDLSTGSEFAVALNANITTLTILNVPSASKVTTLTIKFTADGTARTITWPASFKWPGGTSPTMTSPNGKVDIVTARTYDGGTSWYPALYGQNS